MVKKANHKYDTIAKIKKVFNIQTECKTEEDIVSSLCIGDKQLEYVAIKLFVDKVIHNKYFDVTLENYKLCKDQASKLFN